MDNIDDPFLLELRERWKALAERGKGPVIDPPGDCEDPSDRKFRPEEFPGGE